MYICLFVIIVNNTLYLDYNNTYYSVNYYCYVCKLYY